MKKIKDLLRIHNMQHIFNNDFNVAVYQENGLNSKEIVELNKEMKNKKLQMIHLKNSLARIALKNNKYNSFSHLFEGPSILIYTTKSIENYKFIYSLHKKFSKLIPIGGILTNNYVTAKQFDWILELSHPLEPYLSIERSINNVIQTNINLLYLQISQIDHIIQHKR